MSSGIYILYISIYILIFYIMFIRKRFKAGEKKFGAFLSGGSGERKYAAE